MGLTEQCVQSLKEHKTSSPVLLGCKVPHGPQGHGTVRSETKEQAEGTSANKKTCIKTAVLESITL